LGEETILPVQHGFGVSHPKTGYSRSRIDVNQPGESLTVEQFFRLDEDHDFLSPF
jgi:hypothetical protein